MKASSGASGGEGLRQLSLRRAGPGVGLALVRVASVRNAVALAVTPLDPALYIASRGGRVYRLAHEGVKPRLVLDLSSEVSCCQGEPGHSAWPSRQVASRCTSPSRMAMERAM